MASRPWDQLDDEMLTDILVLRGLWSAGTRTFKALGLTLYDTRAICGTHGEVREIQADRGTLRCPQCGGWLAVDRSSPL